MACRQSRMEFIRVLLLKLASWLLRLLNTKKRTSNRLLLRMSWIIRRYWMIIVWMYRWCMICRQIKQNWSVWLDRICLITVRGLMWMKHRMYLHVFLLYVNGLCCHLWEELIIHLRIGICWHWLDVTMALPVWQKVINGTSFRLLHWLGVWMMSLSFGKLIGSLIWNYVWAGVIPVIRQFLSMQRKEL